MGFALIRLGIERVQVLHKKRENIYFQEKSVPFSVLANFLASSNYKEWEYAVYSCSLQGKKG